jgi:hypothetical protein
LNKQVDWDSDTVKVLLCSSSYTPDQDAHQYRSDLTSEVTGTGYTAGGVALTSRTSSYVGASNTLVLDADDATFSNVTLTARYGIVYVDTGTSSTSPLLGYVDFGANVTPSAQPLVITWDATDGVLKLVAA